MARNTYNIRWSGWCKFHYIYYTSGIFKELFKANLNFRIFQLIEWIWILDVGF